MILINFISYLDFLFLMAKLLYTIKTLLQPLLKHNHSMFFFLSYLCISNSWFYQAVWISTMKNDRKIF